MQNFGFKLPKYRKQTRLDDLSKYMKPSPTEVDFMGANVNMNLPRITKPPIGPSKMDATGMNLNQPIIGPMPGKNKRQNVTPTITQVFGARGAHEKYSGGVNYGTDFAVPRGTQAKLPKGEWQVIESFDKATVGGPGNVQASLNRGYGNSVLVRNKDTGEMLRFSHLRPGGVFVKPGQTIKGGNVIGETGATGNTAGKTGQHLDLEYYTPKGRLADVLRTNYYKEIF